MGFFWEEGLPGVYRAAYDTSKKLAWRICESTNTVRHFHILSQLFAIEVVRLGDKIK